MKLFLNVFNNKVSPINNKDLLHTNNMKENSFHILPIFDFTPRKSLFQRSKTFLTKYFMKENSFTSNNSSTTTSTTTSSTNNITASKDEEEIMNISNRIHQGISCLIPSNNLHVNTDYCFYEPESSFYSLSDHHSHCSNDSSISSRSCRNNNINNNVNHKNTVNNNSVQREEDEYSELSDFSTTSSAHSILKDLCTFSKDDHSNDDYDNNNDYNSAGMYIDFPIHPQQQPQQPQSIEPMEFILSYTESNEKYYDDVVNYKSDSSNTYITGITDNINSINYNHTTTTITTTTITTTSSSSGTTTTATTTGSGTTDVCIIKLKPVKSNSHVFHKICRHASTVAIEVMPI